MAQTYRHNKYICVVNVIEVIISGDKPRGRFCLEYMKQITTGMGLNNYSTPKSMTCDQEIWKAANRSKE